MFFLQLTINGLIAGSVYALVASGFSLIYGTNKVMHFAHGVSVAVAGYILYSLFTLGGINFYVSAFLTLVMAGFFGLGMYFFVYSHLQKKSASNVILLIASIGLLILFQNIIQAVFGTEVRSLGFIGVSKGIDIFGAIITPLQISIIALSGAILIFLYLLMKKTKLGRNMRAVADNRELAEIVGVNCRKIAAYSFFIGSVLAGIAGILIGLEQNLRPLMGTNLIIRGFTGAVIGGITSVPASVLGSYILGLAENYGIWFLPSGFKDAIAFFLLFVFLLFKPNGLFGIKKSVKNT